MFFETKKFGSISRVERLHNQTLLNWVKIVYQHGWFNIFYDTKSGLNLYFINYINNFYIWSKSLEGYLMLNLSINDKNSSHTVLDPNVHKVMTWFDCCLFGHMLTRLVVTNSQVIYIC